MEIEERYYHNVYSSSLKKQLWKKMEEQWAQFILSYYNAIYSSLECLDSPDLQNKDKSLAIEVVNIKSEAEGEIDGNFANYVNPNSNEKTIQIAKHNLEKHGIELTFPGVMTRPSISDRNRLDNIVAAYNKKIYKIQSYKMRGFKKIGLYLFNENPPINPNLSSVATELKKNFKKHDFDIIFYSSANNLVVMNGEKEIVDIFIIKNEDYVAMGQKARAIVEQRN